MSQRFLPYGRQVIDDDDRRAVAAVFDGDFLTTGPYVEAFEEDLCRVTGSAHAVVCSSGTAALHLSALALGLGPGDVVLVPSVTFAATANAARYVGAEVMFVDIDPDTGLMTPETLTDAIDTRSAPGRLRAVFPVHLAGHAVEMPAIKAIADERNLDIVEDAAHAIGTRYGNGEDWIAVGGCRHSQMTIFSFHPVKTITSGEGGAVTTNDPRLAARLKLLRSHGIVRDVSNFVQRDLGFADDGSPNPWYYEITEIGFNYRITDLQCALGRSQLRKLDRFVARRAVLVERYRQALAPMAPIVKPLTRVHGCQPGWHLAVALIDFATAGVDRATVMRELADRGIGSQVHYMPLHMQPCYRERYGTKSLPGAEAYYARSLSLPLFADMTDDDVDHVAATLAEVLGIAP